MYLNECQSKKQEIYNTLNNQKIKRLRRQALKGKLLRGKLLRFQIKNICPFMNETN